MQSGNLSGFKAFKSVNEQITWRGQTFFPDVITYDSKKDISPGIVPTPNLLYFKNLLLMFDNNPSEKDMIYAAVTDVGTIREDLTGVIYTDALRLDHLLNGRIEVDENWCTRKNGEPFTPCGYIYFKNGYLHRDNGLAIDIDTRVSISDSEPMAGTDNEKHSGKYTGKYTKVWAQNSVISREDGPAYITERVQKWIHDGILGRTNGPAVIYANGMQEWHYNGILHRDNGPALILPWGTKMWWNHGKLHNINGPAVEHPDGTVKYFINDFSVREKDHPINATK
jgi:hypothetical protein